MSSTKNWIERKGQSFYKKKHRNWTTENKVEGERKGNRSIKRRIKINKRKMWIEFNEPETKEVRSLLAIVL